MGLDSAAVVSWRKSSSKKVRAYQVRSSKNGGKSWSAPRRTKGTSLRINGLRNGAAYTFKVRALSKSRHSRWSRRSAPVVAAARTASSTGKVSGVYWTGWNPEPGLAALPGGFNLAYLFAAHNSTGGRVTWDYARPTGIETVRARGMKVLLSTGGAGSGISFDSRGTSTEFVDSIEAINASWGGTRSAPAFDGVDLNTFEASAVPNTSEYLWIAQELKRRFGAQFLITCPPAPWKQADRDFARTMLAAGAMDYVAPQYYDGPGLSDPTYIASSVRTWITDIAAGDASRVVIGFGISPGSANYSTTAQVAQAWQQVEAEFPAIRGAFVWSHSGDAANGWGFATAISPLILS